MKAINLDVVEKLAIALAYRQGLTMDDLHNKNVERAIDDEGDVVLVGDFDWLMSYSTGVDSDGTGVDSDFQDSMAGLLEATERCKSFVEQGNFLEYYECTILMMVYIQNLENFFSDMVDDLEKLKSYDDDRYGQYLKEQGESEGLG